MANQESKPTSGSKASNGNPQMSVVSTRATALSPHKAVKAQYSRSHWVVTVPEPFMWVDNPSYWLNHAARFHEADILEIMDEKLTYWGLHIVVKCDNIASKVWLSTLIEKQVERPASDEEADSSHYYFQHEGLTDKFVIRRRVDDQVMEKGLPTADHARKHIVTVLSQRPTV